MYATVLLVLYPYNFYIIQSGRGFYAMRGITHTYLGTRNTTP